MPSYCVERIYMSDHNKIHEIVTVTMNPAIDKSTHVERVAPEQKLACRLPDFDPGGGGINAARAITKLGGRALALYLAGGASGEMLQDLLDNEGVEQNALPIQGRTRTNLTVLDETSGQQYRFGMPGPSVKQDEWKRMLETVRTLEPAPRYLVAGGSLPRGVPTDFFAQLASLAAEQGARFILDTRGPPLRAAMATTGKVYLIKPNARELGMLAQTAIDSEEEQERVAQELVHSGQCEVVLVSLGAAGALLITQDKCRRIRAPSVKVVSKIGAGDSTVGGLVLALTRNFTLVEAARYGVAAGAAAVISPGTQLCRREDAERLYRKIAEE